MSESEQLTGGRLNAAVANTVVQIRNQYFGRGPSRGHAFFRDRIIVVVMHLIEAFEGLTGCTMAAFMSDNHTSPDMAAELFVLDRPVAGEPTTGGSESDSDGNSGGDSDAARAPRSTTARV